MVGLACLEMGMWFQHKSSALNAGWSVLATGRKG